MKEFLQISRFKVTVILCSSSSFCEYEEHLEELKNDTQYTENVLVFYQC